MTEATQSLLPCPKCESENVSISDCGRGVYCVICKDCCIQTKFYQAKADVIADWNTRRISHSLPGETLRDAMSRRGAMSVVAGGGQKPYLKITFDSLDLAYAANDALTAALTPSPCPGDVGMAIEEAAARIKAVWFDYSQPIGMALFRKMAEAALDVPNCEHCDGTGDVHSIDGEWRGRCHCCAALTPSALSGDAGEGE